MQERSHKVERLPVHLPNQQSVIFRESDDISTILEKSSHTKLTRYFEICANNQDDLVIKNLRYIDIPKFFLWENGNWHRRKRSGDKVISRLYMCSSRDKEMFYLRILLTQIHGATSYNDMRTINRNLYDTYEEAVRELGLLDDENDEFDKCIKEAATYKMPSKLRQLFASILLFCDPRELKAYDLLHDNIQYLNEDYYHQQEILFKQKKLHQQRNLDENNENLSDNDLSDEDLPDEYVAIAVNKALVDIEKYLVFYGKKLEDYGIVPPKYELLEEVQEINLISEEMNYDINELNTFLTREEKNLNVD